MEYYSHPFENKIISEEEVRRMNKEAFQAMGHAFENKASDDYSFDDMFNGYIEGRHYQAENGYVMFIEFENKFDDLYCYYQYTKRFIKSFVAIAEESYREKEELGFAEAEHFYGDLIYTNYQAILMMACATFEVFLRDFIEVIDKNAGVLKNPYDDFTTLQYLKFLNYQKNIFIPKKLFHQYNEIRLVRNFFVHSQYEPQAQLKKYIGNDPYGILRGKYIYLNEEYMEFTFETLGRMVKAIEVAFEKYYPEIQ